jgi:hypothetical protein
MPQNPRVTGFFVFCAHPWNIYVVTPPAVSQCRSRVSAALKVLAEIKHYKPRVLKTSLSNEDEAKLKAALSKAA